MRADNLCNRNVIFADQHASVLTSAKLMCQHHVGSIAVIENILICSSLKSIYIASSNLCRRHFL